MANCKQPACQEKFKTMIGGQALIEGIMMQGPEKHSCGMYDITKAAPLR